MALLNNRYILVENESIDNSVETTSHPTETGLPLSDTVRRKPISISISGVIVNTDTATARQTVDGIKTLQKNGSLVDYVGAAGKFSSLQIQSFNATYTNKVHGGASFDMTLQEIRVAKSAYVENSEQKVLSLLKMNPVVGDIVQFLGGYVYVASDAEKPAAARGISTCKLTKISSLNNAKHIYHLISTDGRLVYGWVDKGRVTWANSQQLSSSNGGTQQVQGTPKAVVYHTVKRGETIYTLVNTTYKSMNLSVTKVINDNPMAFSVKGDPKTLIVGAKLALG